MPRDTALTSGGAQLGTDCYMSPEQFRNTRDVDIRTDIYAAGKMLIELWVGYSVPGKQGADDLPKDLRYIAEKCLEDKPEMRYQNGSELHAAFELLSETMEKSTSERIDDLILWGDVFETASDNQISEMARLFDDLDDDNLHKKLPELSTENLKRCHAIDRSSTRSFVIKYCEHACSQLWPFAHTDKLCDSLNVFLKTFDDPIIKATSIYAQYKIGASHNRYYVIREFGKNIVAVSSDIPTVMEIENLLKKKKIDSLHKSIGYVSVQEVHKTLQKLFIKSSPREF